MAYYSELNGILNTVIGEYILNNQNICKMLYFYPDEDVMDYDPLKEKDIENTNSLLLKHIFPIPKSIDATTNQKGFMTIVLTGSDIVSSNKGYRKVLLLFDIVFHLDNWIIKNGFRPYYIAEEIDKMFNNKITGLPIIGTPVSLPFKVRSYSSAYYGIQMKYELLISSNISCNEQPKNLNINRDVFIRKRQFIPRNTGDINGNV